MLRAAAARARARSQLRHYAVPAAAPEPVQLSSEKHAAPSSSSQAPVIVLHGLFGSKQNWRSLAKGMAQRLDRDIITLVRLLCFCHGCGECIDNPRPPPVQDLRNHGQSPHRRECSYEDLAADVQAFIEQEEKLSDCVVVGHSMCVLYLSSISGFREGRKTDL